MKGNAVQRDRIKLEILVDLDPVPGPFHTEDDARMRIEAMLLNIIPHYNPALLPKE